MTLSRLDEQRETLHIRNLLGAYVYLLDSKGRIRWAASGEASPEEVQTMLAFADELREEHKANLGQEETPEIEEPMNKSKRSGRRR